MLKLEKVATPPEAAMLVVPESVPPAGLVPIATVTLPVNPVAALPSASRAVICTAGVIAAPAVTLVGWTETNRSLAAPGVTLKGALGTVGIAAAPVVSV